MNPQPADDAPQFMKDYYDYYKTKRGYHERSVNYTLALAAMLLTLCITTACSEDDPVLTETETPAPPVDEGNNDDTEEPETPTPPDSGEDDNDNKEDNPMNRNITITVGGTSFAATLADNETARAFAAMLPMTIQMNELNGNEKYHYLDSSLPTGSYRPGTIRTGDLMLYGSDCIVLFYETFSSSYSYTRLGQVDNPDGLAKAVGSGNVSVKFEMRQQ